MGEKWAERREARRAGEPPASGELREGWVWGPERPRSLRIAFVLWMVLGIPLVIAIVGIVIVLAAINLRAGYRGARVWLTVLFGLSVLQFVGGLVVIIALGVRGELDSALPLLLLVPAGIATAAMIATWHPDTTAYLRELRELGERVA
ncbi:hypothetical protein [Amycolatopsis magusensis]|uniref:hypothetical protein n=1 Tax=Amycolatopsis magusensis TaxID=882444 RepID=UPI00379CB576